MDKTKPFFTIYTATYNREKLLPRAYESVKKQTFRDFEWLILDDGSTDGTAELVKKWQAEADFPIIYEWQNNGGKHIALNAIIETFNGEFVVSLDSDDEMVPETLERFKYHWDILPEEDKKVVGWFMCLSKDQDGTTYGDRFPKDVQVCDGIKMYLVTKIKGEKGGAIKGEAFKMYRYPPDVRNVYVPEEVFMQMLAKDWKALCINEVLRVYWVDKREDHDGQNMNKPKNYKGNRLLNLAYLNYTMRLFWYVPRIFYANAAYYVKLSLHLGYGVRKQWTDIHTFSGKLLWLAALLPGYILYRKDRNHVVPVRTKEIKQTETHA
jgi:glycosyltransferase involved in cell wall biosynthesis